MTFLSIFWHFSLDQKAPFFRSKKSPFFINIFALFLIMVSVDHISSPSAGTGPLDIKWYEICASLPRQICFSANFAKQGRGEGPRTVALRANPSSVYRELTRRVIIVIVIEKGKREFMMFACVSVRVEGKERGGDGVLW